MKQRLIGLCDCNSFYASCEMALNPRLQHKPVVIASNNDGVVVTGNAAAKALGLGMGVPLFKVQDLIKKHDVRVFSSNYALYGDLSQRVMAVLEQHTPEQEIYSIDECFIRMPEFAEATTYARNIKETVKQWTGIPVSMGVATSKTLAKIANHVAKKQKQYDGVFDLSTARNAEGILATFPVKEIWGIGRQYNKWLLSQGIETAKELRDANEGMIRQKMGVVGVRMIHELRGISCLPLELVAKPKKEICVSRSFGQPVTELTDLQDAIAAYASRAAEKLRQEQQVAEAMIVFARTSPFKSGYFRQSATVQFPIATSYTPAIVEAARKAMARIYEPGREFQKAGVLMVGLCSETTIQGHLWEKDEGWEKRKRLMLIMDEVNHRFGRGTIGIAASGAKQTWKMQSKWRSPRYTTCWAELPVVSC
ncbi:Y-family DNA polymerase [Acaryochloris sp. CCMEE 5410]|uniref:Y-family DNA polymerase n=1 Tax=Acaryochloris sp. CCMEE 5410 TaxID=310037 RepID=UPI00049490BF|nr:Y-family DNA polymerase [Acaryochloris sp. CCMEE 5410]KAI9134268.1 Y-family DNA polymerase [Acaryochloris sp. CCMEE 5410]